MSDFVQDTTSMIILGDEENKEFDGKFKYNGKKEGYFYHRDSLRQIIKELKQEGYPLTGIDVSTSHESGFNLINMGHILFCNSSFNKTYFGYLFLPNKLTNKQIKTLKNFEETFQNFPKLYLMKINKEDREVFDITTNSNYFNVDEIINDNYHNKTKKM